MYADFIGWTQNETARAIRKPEQNNETIFMLSANPRALTFQVMGDWPYRIGKKEISYRRTDRRKMRLGIARHEGTGCARPG